MNDGYRFWFVLLSDVTETTGVVRGFAYSIADLDTTSDTGRVFVWMSQEAPVVGATVALDTHEAEAFPLRRVS